ncbi:MAG: glutamate--tRNA ligase family protein [Bacteroidota bacterium]
MAVLEVVSRIAPTPSGFLHIGNAFNFLLTWLVCRKQKGKLILRIDDLDQARMRSEYLEDIFRTIDWLGISVDEGPSGPEDHLSNYSQVHRLALYEEAIQGIKTYLFPCAYSRKQIQAASRDGQYPEEFRNQDTSWEAEGVAWRLLTLNSYKVCWTDQVMGEVEVSLFDSMRDFVVRKKDGVASYQIASLVDDLQLGVNCICRGEDLLHSTAAQLYLASLLEKGTFSQTLFYHHHLLTDDKGEKLSKSHASLSMHETGYSSDLRQYLFNEILQKVGRVPNSIQNAEELGNSLSLNEIIQIGAIPI